MTGAEAIVSVLERLDVERVFGIPGVQNLELFDALADASFPTINVTHEASAAFMADAQGRLTGKPGVLAVVPGPGITNAATGLGEALLDSSPVLVLASSVHNDSQFRFQLHDINQKGVLKNLAKEVIQVERAADLAQAVWNGFHLASTGEPGPVVVEIPFNLLSEKVRVKSLDQPEALLGPGKHKLDQICTLIRNAKKPGIYAGAGAMHCSRDLITLAEKLCSPVATTMSGRGVIPEDHYLSVGFGFGGCGTALAQKAFTGCDLLIAVGCKFGEVATGSYGFKLPKKTIHIDANPRVIGANFLPTVGMIADAGQALSSILSEIGSYERKDECSFVDGLTREKSLYFEAIQDLPDNADYVNPRKLLVRLRVQLDRNAILTTDSGNHSFYVLSDFQALLPRTVIAPTDYNAMGFSVPAAVSASLQFPDRQVVSIVGDGGFLMTGVELLTARKMGARPITIVFHDGALGLIKVMQQNLMRRPSAVDLPSMDLKGFAKWLDLEYVLIENDLEIDSGLRRALRAKRPVVVDAKVRYQEPTRYFKAVALANARRMPFSQVTRIGGRLLRRLVLPSKKL